MVMLNFNANESFEQLKDRWALEVGRFVMAFGNIEANTYLALRHMPLDPIGEPLIDANLNLKPRIEVLIAIASKRGGEQWLVFADALEKIKRLAAKRNLIAHNGVGFDVYINAAGEYYVEQAISNAKKRQFGHKKPTDSVLFNELMEHRAEAEELDKQLGAALIEILKELDSPKPE
jgi:hypothetical protein